MTKQLGEKGKKNYEASLSESIEDAQQNSASGRYSEAEMIARLKELAMNPCKLQFAGDNIQPLQNQILRLRKIMVLQDSLVPWRKRKLEQFVKDKLRAPSGLPVPNQENGIKLRKQFSHPTSLSCLLNSVDSTKEHYYKRTPLNSRSSGSLLTFDNTFTGKRVSECSFINDTVHWNCLRKDTSPIVDSDESVNGSNNAIDHSSSPTSSMRWHNVIGDNQQRKVIPVGPRFQADVPEWINPANRNILIDKYKGNSDNSKWLGTQIRPTKIANMKTTGRTIGKGRPQTCCCVSPGSVDCIRRHILEEKQHLKCDLGPAFFSWKFDEMGEQVSNSWSLKEQQTFESLIKLKSSCNGKKFSKNAALKSFPKKCWSEIVRYYFNIYIPQRISLQRRSSSLNHIDTDDDDDEEDVSYMGTRKRSHGGALISNFKHVKA